MDHITTLTTPMAFRVWILLDSLSDYNTSVAQLMYHAGVSVEMDYGTSSSSASTGDVVTALQTYFKYNSRLFYARKEDHSDDDWQAMLRTELNNNRPILYRGAPAAGSGGHAFVCDGYSEDGFFHFNWGWGGNYDGNFKLDDLTPGTRNYTQSQKGIIGITPANDPDLTYPYIDTFEKNDPRELDVSGSFAEMTSEEKHGGAFSLR
ncbi:MAG: C10 family peptidase, partial [Candidatus Marinimicrobia bacterium]|nr:C10 family peptidase [Candidatus Neomarinimicrobiota bacterium]